VLRSHWILLLALAAPAARPDGLSAQQTARAAVSVAVAPPLLSAEVLDRATALALAGPGSSVARPLPAGARLIASPPPRAAPASTLRRAPDPRARPVRRLTLVYAAN
jgi:hypothetical protein